MAVFVAVVLVRLFTACETCKVMRSRIAVALFSMPNPVRQAVGIDSSQSHMVCEIGRQLRHQPIRIVVLDGLLVLDNRLFKAVCDKCIYPTF